MPVSNISYDAIEQELEDILKLDPVIEIDENLPAAIVRAPMSMSPGGRAGVISVDNVPSLEDLPFIPENLRDFAYRYATEYKSNPAWAKIYGVGVKTIRTWLKKEGVQALIAISRYEQRTYNVAQRSVMNNQVYTTMNNILRTKITADTIGPIVAMSKFIYKILNEPEHMAQQDASSKGVFNASININNSPGAPSPYAQSQKMVNVTPRQISELRSDIDELEMMAEDFGVDLDK